ncbi:MAG TPA: hypothetical protein VH741_08590 [Candidatus Limnocylindrales bacterium]|jgi:hypothetical protein
MDHLLLLPDRRRYALVAAAVLLLTAAVVGLLIVLGLVDQGPSHELLERLFMAPFRWPGPQTDAIPA